MPSKIIQESTPTTSVVQSPSRKPKINLLILLVITLLFGAIGGYYLGSVKGRSTTQPQSSPWTQPFATPDETADWKTYTNEKLGFSLKYPDYPTGTKIVEKETSVKFYANTPNGPYETSEFPGITVEVYSNNTDKIGESWIIEKNMGLVLKDSAYIDLRWEKVDNWYISTKTINIANAEYYAYGFINTRVYRINTADRTKLNQILSTFKFLDESSSSTSVSTSTTAKPLTYSLPVGWKTVQDETGTFEIGYDPNMHNVTPGNKVISFFYKNHYGSFGFSAEPYDNGSRHQFIYQKLGYINGVAAGDKTPDYHEQEYSYQGWRCIVLYGLTFSASGTTWGMCPVSSTQAIFINGPGGEDITEQMIKTIKLL